MAEGKLTARAGDLPQLVAQQLIDPVADTSRVVAAGGYEWHVREWGSAEAPALLLLHGAGASSETFWRVGPALAASGWRSIALDLPGHGLTGGWRGRHVWIETAHDVVTVIRAMGLDGVDLPVIGHSWGAVIAAHLPQAGFPPERMILIDPPAIGASALAVLANDPTERRYARLADAIDAIRASGVTWADRDIEAKARALTQIDDAAARAVYLGNGDYDAAVAAIAWSAARSPVPIWLIRGEPEQGGLIDDDARANLAAHVGAEHIITIAGAGHSPQRTHPEATVVAILRGLA